jgi:hypothetical protein
MRGQGSVWLSGPPLMQCRGRGGHRRFRLACVDRHGMGLATVSRQAASGGGDWVGRAAEPRGHGENTCICGLLGQWQAGWLASIGTKLRMQAKWDVMGHRS